jgi:hypothetical protein
MQCGQRHPEKENVPVSALRSHDEIEASLLCLLADELSRIAGGA